MTIMSTETKIDEAPTPTYDNQDRPREHGGNLRTFMRNWHAGIAVITGISEGVPLGLVSNSLTSLSLKPPLISWAVAKSSSSYAAWLQADNFAIHVLSEEDIALFDRFKVSGPHKFDNLAWQQGVLGSPLIATHLPVIECKIWKRVDVGDHALLIGEVVEVTNQEPEKFVPMTPNSLQAK